MPEKFSSKTHSNSPEVSEYTVPSLKDLHLSEKNAQGVSPESRQLGYTLNALRKRNVRGKFMDEAMDQAKQEDVLRTGVNGAEQNPELHVLSFEELAQSEKTDTLIALEKAMESPVLIKWFQGGGKDIFFHEDAYRTSYNGPAREQISFSFEEKKINFNFYTDDGGMKAYSLVDNILQTKTGELLTDRPSFNRLAKNRTLSSERFEAFIKKQEGKTPFAQFDTLKKEKIKNQSKILVDYTRKLATSNLRARNFSQNEKAELTKNDLLEQSTHFYRVSELAKTVKQDLLAIDQNLLNEVEEEIEGLDPQNLYLVPSKLYTGVSEQLTQLENNMTGFQRDLLVPLIEKVLLEDGLQQVFFHPGKKLAELLPVYVRPDHLTLLESSRTDFNNILSKANDVRVVRGNIEKATELGQFIDSLSSLESGLFVSRLDIGDAADSHTVSEVLKSLQKIASCLKSNDSAGAINNAQNLTDAFDLKNRVLDIISSAQATEVKTPKQKKWLPSIKKWFVGRDVE